MKELDNTTTATIWEFAARSKKTTFLTARMTIAAALASKPVVGSSINITAGLATSSTAIVSRLRCSVDRPLTPGIPTKIASNFDFTFNVTTTFSSRKNVKKCCFASTSDTHQCSKNTRPE
ncbi:hypothetical protein RJ639_016129 [Escallonia herrerae]|uniref:Uncharacterized protein n=1 Tax=Escallonia herrerae TaxID=1293975 RepID=A0AA89AJX0_9ASTE|nr:hypothetical protein RJ639_016129 [Escallonia herrerae]